MVKPTSGDTPNSSPRSLSVPSPRESWNVWRAARASPRRASSHSTAIRAAHPASSPAPVTARCRSGRRKPAPSTSAPTSVTDRGITVSPAFVSASPPAVPRQLDRAADGRDDGRRHDPGERVVRKVRRTGRPQPQRRDHRHGDQRAQDRGHRLQPAVAGEDCLVGAGSETHPATLSSARGTRLPGGPSASACGRYGIGAHNGDVAETSCENLMNPLEILVGEKSS